jgi:hypothetical protein
VPEFADNTAEVSAQNTSGLLVEMVAVGFETSMEIDPDAFEVPAVAVHVYVVEAAVGETTSVSPMVPSLHT